MFKDIDINHSVLFKQVIRFAVVGGTGLIANILLLVLFVEMLNIAERLAAIYSTLIVLIGGFIATNWWVFTGKDNNSANTLLKRGSSYYTIMLTSKLVNYGIYSVLISIDIWYPLAWATGSVCVFLATFSLNRLVWYKTG